MSTLDKLRALHKEVCEVWRRHFEYEVSDGEAEILNLGFLLLQRFAEVWDLSPSNPQLLVDIVNNEVCNYVNRVHSQFDSDADIVIKGE